eukprot:TRINITY_DN4651_c0_g1_i2.p1 TRINITY_DN4651_c0_g1~~TRINITY_DN4651_c0_g1_i2.p1  ORF type:complete len:490 (+),score=60.13 TRINITY_DN4651_c0_g1_i2:23-1471(+)
MVQVWRRYIIVLLLFFGGCLAFELHVSPQTLHLVDEQNRTRIFHGTNVVYKAAPYIPVIDHFDHQYSFSAQDVSYLTEWGVNAIRLGVMWPGVEPVRGQYNDTYLGMAKTIVERCERANISVLIDMHQDSWSEKFCGEGAPLWAAVIPNGSQPFPEPAAPAYTINATTGLPTAQNCSQHSWSTYYFSSALGKSVQALYDNHDGLLDSFAAYWKLLATTFKPYNNIIGYELMNEPWAGDVIADPLLLVPGVADRKNLQRVYEVTAAAIRRVDPATPVFFESVTWDDVLVGFDQPPGGEAYRNKSVYAYHWYAPPNLPPLPSMQAHKREAARLQCGWFCTESDGLPFFEVADEYFQSWLRWEYKSFIPITGSNPGFWFSNGTLNEDMIFNLTRTYASAINGVPSRMHFNQTTAEFELTFVSNRPDTITEVYAYEKLHYPNGVSISVEPSDALTWARIKPNYFSFYPTASMKMYTPVTIRITNIT